MKNTKLKNLQCEIVETKRRATLMGDYMGVKVIRVHLDGFALNKGSNYIGLESVEDG